MRLTRSSVPSLYAITSGRGEHRDEARRLAESGVLWIQIREKSVDDLTLHSDLIALRSLLPGNVSLIVNDRPDLLRLSGASGLHLGDRDLPARLARVIVGDDVFIGASSHSVAQAVALVADDDVDYIAVGPIFESPTKNIRAPLGLEVIRFIRDATDKPLVAIGGIKLQDIGSVIRAGADSVAVISALYENDAIEANVEALLTAAESR